ncbi:hypothetical protein Csa_007921 [Cucumis sativus]|uniref:Uncharacterized protein n=1 Tax=Cucumis sativus TaxID=3659 RepID=A0A0A0KMV6_CUCSA|nr:hypothetical protein Csa_007921 [Cucumis sativus]
MCLGFETEEETQEEDAGEDRFETDKSDDEGDAVEIRQRRRWQRDQTKKEMSAVAEGEEEAKGVPQAARERETQRTTEGREGLRERDA